MPARHWTTAAAATPYCHARRTPRLVNGRQGSPLPAPAVPPDRSCSSLLLSPRFSAAHSSRAAQPAAYWRCQPVRQLPSLSAQSVQAGTPGINHAWRRCRMPSRMPEAVISSRNGAQLLSGQAGSQHETTVAVITCHDFAGLACTQQHLNINERKPAHAPARDTCRPFPVSQSADW
jgi:hypothetical protein